MAVPELFAAVVGQPAAVERLRAASEAPVHAYLFVGPSGSGRAAAARAFAAALLCPHGGDATCRTCRLALAGAHPDLWVLEREGRTIRREEAEAVRDEASRSPVEGARKVLVLPDFEVTEPIAAALLLKTIEEPPPGRVFVVLASGVPAELVTIASRCVRVDFGPVPDALVEERLVAEGVVPEVAAEAAAAAGGDLARARRLAADPGAGARRAAWRSVPERLDGTGATVAALAAELLAGLEAAVAPVKAAQAAEPKEAGGVPLGAGALKALEARQKREVRRVRTEELVAGLAALAGAYRDRVVAGRDVAVATAALSAVSAAHESLERNPNEALLVQGLLARLSG